jgi:hypothetical protein
MSAGLLRAAAAAWLLLPAAEVCAQDLLAGASRAVFELPPGVPLAGYSRRDGRPSTGTRDPVGARALVLERGGRTVVLASADLLIIDERLAGAVERRLAGGPLDGAALLLAATHTHSGPGAWGAKFLEKVSMGHYDEAVFNRLADGIARAAAQAHAARAAAGLACETGQVEGWSRNRTAEDGPVDAEVPVCVVRRLADQGLIAVLTGFAAHPTTLGASNMALSADYPGVLVRQVEAAFPDAVCLFFAGAAADQAPVKSGEGFEPAERLGRALAAHVTASVDRQRAGEPVRVLDAARERMPLAAAQVRVGPVRLPRWLGRRMVDDDATLSVVRAGPLAVFGAPCDLASTLGGELKAAARSRGDTPLVAGFANDYVGYCMPESFYTSGQYEAELMFNGPSTGADVVRRLLALHAGLGGEAR